MAIQHRSRFPQIFCCRHCNGEEKGTSLISGEEKGTSLISPVSHSSSADLSPAASTPAPVASRRSIVHSSTVVVVEWPSSFRRLAAAELRLARGFGRRRSRRRFACC